MEVDQYYSYFCIQVSHLLVSILIEDFFLMDRLNIFMSGLTIEKHISSIIIGEIPLGPGGLEIFNIFN